MLAACHYSPTWKFLETRHKALEKEALERLGFSLLSGLKVEQFLRPPKRMADIKRNSLPYGYKKVSFDP